ncbi:MAG: OmpP1/FadL family transporter [bacterium]
MDTRIVLNIKTVWSIGALVCFVLFILQGPVYSQEIPDISINSLQPVGSGARAIGMGGAFIGIADDATAASWNPAGLLQLKRAEISCAGDFFSIDPLKDQFSYKDDVELNYFSFVYPAYLIKRNMVFSLNYQNLYLVNWEGTLNSTSADNENIPDDFPYIINENTSYTKEGSISAVSPALALQLSPSFTVGFTLNIWPKSLFEPNGWKQYVDYEQYRIPYDPNTHAVKNIKDDYTLKAAQNFHIGFRLKLNPIFTVGAVYKSPLITKFKRKRNVYSEHFPPSPDDFDSPYKDGELYFPESYGIGIAARIHDSLTLDLDIYHTEWDKYSITYDDKNYDPILLEDGESLKSITYIRFGGEYLFILPHGIVPFRFGLFYDPEPTQANHKTIDWPNGCSVGTGLSLKTISLDIAAKYRKIENNNVLKDSNLNIVSTDIEELFLYFSIIYYL